MQHLDFDLRSSLLRRRPNLGLAKAAEMIRDIANGYFQIKTDIAANLPETDPKDFYTFVCADWVFLASIFRQNEMLLAVFEGDYTLIQESEKLSSLQVEEFVELIASKALDEVSWVKAPLPEALEWLKQKAQ